MKDEQRGLDDLLRSVRDGDRPAAIPPGWQDRVMKSVREAAAPASTPASYERWLWRGSMAAGVMALVAAGTAVVIGINPAASVYEALSSDPQAMLEILFLF